ncbi:MAG: hypothetical protein Q9182_002816 [Xanthomendoza sp. 2 TL-2023]
MSDSFVYDVIEPKHIRLFQLDLSTSHDCLAGKLVVFRHPCHYDATLSNFAGTYRNWNDMRFTEKEGPDYGYDALSYAWGSPAETFPLKLQCTGKAYKKGVLRTDGLVQRQGTLAIHRNLHQLLLRLHAMKYDRWIWIDAICINQLDDWEKSLQIPLMRDIYQEAKQVTIWLGPASAVEEGALTIMPNLIKALERCAAESHVLWPSRPETFESAGLPIPSHPIWSALGSFMSRHWFRRLWTLQEAVLPETSSTILCGTKTITWDILESFMTAMWACRLANWTITGDAGIQSDFLNGYESVRMTTLCRDSMKAAKWGVILDILLNVTRRRSVTKPADMVYGMIALMPHGDQAQIDMGASLPLENVYMSLARYYLLNEPDECLLNHTSSIRRHLLLPSWCPDFSSPETTVPLSSRFYGGQRLSSDQYATSFRAGFNRSGAWEKPMVKNWGWVMAKNTVHRRRIGQGTVNASHPYHMRAIPNSKILFCNGAVFDTVAEIIGPNEGLRRSGAWYTPDKAEEILTWEEECLRLARATMNFEEQIPDHYWRTLIANLTWGDKGSNIRWDESNQANHSDAYNSFKATVRELAKGNTIGLDQMTFGDRAFTAEFVRVTRNRCFFSTVGGRIGLGPTDTQVGDDLSVIFFCPTPYMLRHGDHSSFLIGDAYVHEYMYGKALDLIDKGELETRSFELA